MVKIPSLRPEFTGSEGVLNAAAQCLTPGEINRIKTTHDNGRKRNHSTTDPTGHHRSRLPLHSKVPTLHPSNTPILQHSNTPKL
ncbi:MAG: hypothetical protein JJT96_18570, partial [Opitutales bacterium]|nr:hypothetical protein [Opitutales bacterium]